MLGCMVRSVLSSSLPILACSSLRCKLDSSDMEEDFAVVPGPCAQMCEHSESYSNIDQAARVVTVRLFGTNGRLPSKATVSSAGYDLYSSECVTVGSFKAVVIGTNVTISMPKDCYGRIAPRSSLAVKLIDVGGGVIDSDYTGSIMVIVYNFSKDDFVVNVNDKIAQLVIERIFTPIYSNVDRIRGSGGFGSTDNEPK